MRHKLTKHSRIIVILTLALAVGGCQLFSQTQFSDIVSSDPQDYENYQIKLTHMGPQSVALLTMVFGSSSVLDITAFKPYERANFDYQNDVIPAVVEFKVTGAEIQAIVNALGASTVYRDGRDKALPILSMMIMRNTGGPNEQVFETLVEYNDAASLLRDFIIPNLDAGNSHGKDLCQYWLKNVGG